MEPDGIFIPKDYTTVKKIKRIRKELLLTQKRISEFREFRRFPKSRDKMKLILKNLGLHLEVE